MPTPRRRFALTAAVAILALESVGVFVLAALQVVAIVEGNYATLPSVLALTVLTLVAAVGIAAFAVAVARHASWGRSGGIVVQLMVLAVALGASTGIYAHPSIGIALAIPAILGIVALALTARAEAPPRASGEASAPDEAPGR